MTRLAIICCIALAFGCRDRKPDLPISLGVIEAPKPFIATDDGIVTGHSVMPIYFDFDRSEIRKDQLLTIHQMAQLIENHKQFKYTLDGHADERGSPDYNLVLGSERANAVKDVLQSLGVDIYRLTIRTWGEERPASKNHAQNRRVELVVE